MFKRGTLPFCSALSFAIFSASALDIRRQSSAAPPAQTDRVLSWREVGWERYALRRRLVACRRRSHTALQIPAGRITPAAERRDLIRTEMEQAVARSAAEGILNAVRELGFQQ